MSRSRVPTPDGEPLKVDQLNIGGHKARSINSPAARPKGLKGKMVSVYRVMSLFLAGMYTGVKCTGTPNRYHSYDSKRDDGPL